MLSNKIVLLCAALTVLPSVAVRPASFEPGKDGDAVAGKMDPMPLDPMRDTYGRDHEAVRVGLEMQRSGYYDTVQQKAENYDVSANGAPSHGATESTKLGSAPAGSGSSKAGDASADRSGLNDDGTKATIAAAGSQPPPGRSLEEPYFTKAEIDDMGQEGEFQAGLKRLVDDLGNQQLPLVKANEQLSQDAHEKIRDWVDKSKALQGWHPQLTDRLDNFRDKTMKRHNELTAVLQNHFQWKGKPVQHGPHPQPSLENVNLAEASEEMSDGGQSTRE